MRFPKLKFLVVFRIFAGGIGLFGALRTAAADGATAAPTVFVLGDSTARNTAKGKNGEPCAGWGTPLADYIDPAKAVVANVAHAGTSSRSYFNNPGDWPKVLPQIKAGDFVLLVFGINDGAAPPAGRGSLPGIGDETVEVKRPDGTIETAHTYGWYLSTMATAARERGAHVTLLTVTTRDIWTNPVGVEFRAGVANKPLPAEYDSKLDRIERGTGGGKYTQWTKDLGAKLHLPVLDLTNLCADKYEAMGRETVDKFYSDHNHTYAPGADFVAATIVSGLKAFPRSPFAALLSEKGKAVATADSKYVSENPAPAASK
jgi:lysophospholipase L1-like esterase